MSTNKSYKNIEFIFDISKEIDPAFKVVIIGDCKVGKTTLIQSIMGNDFDEEYKSTIGIDFFSFFIKINNKILQLKIWDMSGDAKFNSLADQFLLNSSLVIVIYDITNIESFQHIDSWLQEIKENSPSSEVILVGNKTDLQNERQVQIEEIKNKYKNSQISKFIECSAKIKDNIEEIFLEAANILYKKFIDKKNLRNTQIVEGITTNIIDNSKEKMFIKRGKNSFCNCW